MQHLSGRALRLLALGEPVRDVAAHLRECAVCDGEVRALRATLATALRGNDPERAAPPPVLWQRIADELGTADEPAGARSDGAVPLRCSPRRGPLAAAAAALAVAAAATAVLIGVRGPAPAPTGGQSAPLVALGPTSASGEVALTGGPGRRWVVVDTAGLPPPDGRYEVWLLDRAGARTVALGVLDGRGRGRLPVPDGVQVGSSCEVEVSLEPDDGEPAHAGVSVLRGGMPG